MENQVEIPRETLEFELRQFYNLRTSRGRAYFINRVANLYRSLWRAYRDFYAWDLKNFIHNTFKNV